MTRIRTYVVLGAVVLLGSGLLLNSGSAAARDVLSYISQVGKEGPTSLTLMNTDGEVRRSLLIPDLKRLVSVTWSPDGHSFACSSDRGGNFDIYVMDVRTNEHRQLTFDGSRDSEPAWSPNGKWIAFVSERAGGRDIYRMDANGENVMQLTDQVHCKSPTWSPDSRWIAFTSAPEKERYFLFVMSAEGKRLRQLAKDIPLPGCTWSPDGKQIAFVSRGAERKMEIFSINVNGRASCVNLLGPSETHSSFEPTWSPSGKWIAYTSWEIPVGLVGPRVLVQVGIPGISVVDAVDGGRGRPIESTSGSMPHSISWAPDGFFDVSPSAEKQTTVWGKLKQLGK